MKRPEITRPFVTDMASAALLRVLLAFAFVLAGIGARAEARGLFDIGGDDSSPTRTAIEQLLSHAGTDIAKQTTLRAQLVRFYKSRDFDPAWTGSDDADARAATVLDTLKHADRQGLHPNDYLTPLAHLDAQAAPGHDAADFDIVLTAALLRYANDVRTGRVDPKSVYKDIDLPPRDYDAGAALAKALDRDSLDNYLADLPPIHPGYRMLVDALAHYRAIAAAGGWPAIPGKAGFAINGRDKREAILARRLAFEDPVLAATPNPGDSDIREAILRYQRRNGLDDNGKIGPETLRALNVRASYRVQEIIANMERWRWMPRLLEPRYAEVDVPDQSVKYVYNGKVLLRSKVVIGKKTSPTPILNTMVATVVANPPWDIPGDIAARKILPNLRRHQDYLASRNMVLADGPASDPHGMNINWRKTSGIPFQLQQNPGPDNVLGKLMLDSPNDFDVYMHDTPDKKLFTLTDRERSNGCVRVEHIFELASLALTGSVSAGADELNRAIATGKTQRIRLVDPLPVYMLYWTAIAGPDGTVDFRPDLYSRDARLIAKLGVSRGTAS